MFDVIEALSPVAAKWKAIGTALRIRRNKLDEFESTHKGDVQDCLADTVAEYVRMGYDTKKHGEPTWLKIIKAVEHSAGGNNKAHAIAIAKDHIVNRKLILKVEVQSTMTTNYISRKKHTVCGHGCNF